jgi:hypothetical protein
MKWRSALLLACLVGAVGVACARGSDDAPADDPASSTAPTTPTGPAPKGPLTDGSAPTPSADASGASDAAPVVTPGPDAAPGTFVSGSASSVTIAPAHASAVVVTSGGFIERIVIPIQTHATFCADYAGGIDHAGERSLILVVIATGSSAVGAATYTVGTGKSSSAGGTFDASGRVLSYDASCTTTVSSSKENAASGTITLTHVASNSVVGTFSLTFPGGGQLTGALDADVCTAPGADSFTCKP